MDFLFNLIVRILVPGKEVELVFLRQKFPAEKFDFLRLLTDIIEVACVALSGGLNEYKSPRMHGRQGSRLYFLCLVRELRANLPIFRYVEKLTRS